MTNPPRLRLSRVAGWRLPTGARSVARPGPFGNPFRVDATTTAQACVRQFAAWLAGTHKPDLYPGRRAKLLARLPELRGKPLACWCALPVEGEPDHCHAAVLIQMANTPEAQP